MGQSNNSNSNTGASTQIQNFLESLKERRLSENISPSPVEKFSHKKELQKERIKEFHHARMGEWHSVFSSKEKETEQAIENVRLELKALTHEMKKLEKNIQLAVALPVKKPGKYHKAFYDMLREFLKLLREEAASANSWINIYKSRSLKQGYYWNQASQKGSSFTQNNERAIATSVG
jgi:hypothetical protein